MSRSHWHYEVYGLRLCSGIPLVELPRSSFHFKDVAFSLQIESHEGETLSQGPAELLQRRLTTLGEYFSLFETNDSYILRWEGTGEFLVSKDGKTIRALTPATTDIVWVKGTLYGVVLSFVLHFMGIANLHSSGVVLPEGAVGFLADPGTGKSTLAASLVSQGHGFLTDDVLTIQGGANGYEAFPGFPYMSLDEFSMDVILGPSSLPAPTPGHTVEDKQRVNCSDIGGQFHSGTAPLKGLFVLTRGPDDDGGDGRADPDKVVVKRLSRSDALKCLLDNTVFLPLLPVDVLKRHMAFLAKLTETLPVWSLHYACGFENLPEITAKVLEVAGAAQAVPVGV